jgi:hypothetical protein
MAVKRANWSRKLARPVKAVRGRTLHTLREAADYVIEQEAERRWSPAIEVLIAAATGTVSTEQATLELERALFAARELDLRGQTAMRLAVPKRPKR